MSGAADTLPRPAVACLALLSGFAAVVAKAHVRQRVRELITRGEVTE